MQCFFGSEVREDGRYTCEYCGRLVVTKDWPPWKIHATCREPSTRPLPGTELMRLLKELDIKPIQSCKCNARASEMNSKGVEWCKANKTHIAGWLKEAALESSWLTVFAAAGGLIAQSWFKPFSPFESIVTEAIRRSENTP
jgi:hypothetical protein